MTAYQHWKVERDTDEIAWLHLDKADSSANVLSTEVLDEFAAILDDLSAQIPRGVVILSDKENGFIAGADVNEFTRLKSEEEAITVMRKVHGVFNKLEAFKCPTIAMIHGFCLGGGLELAMACRYRIADTDPKTRLGFPEVKLGIHPGFGGSARAIRAIGALSAMDIMLSGRSLNTRAARKIGLIDFAVAKRHFINAARSIINRPPTKKPLAAWKKALSFRQIRPLIAKILIRKVAARASRAHYPAPYALIELWVNYYDSFEGMLEQEIQSVAHLIVGRTAQNLIRIFQLQDELKSHGQYEHFNPVHVHVIGGGIMGGDIAAWCAYRGFTVTIQDTKHEALANVVKRGHALFKKRLKDRLRITAAMDRLIPDPKGNGLRRADVVIEAIFEDVKVKQELFAAIEPVVKPDAILATNTSTIPLDAINSVLKQPSRLVGLHFFNPVSMMPLVEVVQSDTTDAIIAEKAATFTRKIDRLPLTVSSTPGFFVNRVLMPYFMEAMALVQENVPLSVIDNAATDFGMPLGPIELADTVGLDILLHAAEYLAPEMNTEVPETLKKMVKNGQLGKKSGRGFYEFKNGKAIKDHPPKEYTPPVDIQDRLILSLLNEVVACLRNKVVDTPDHADAGIVFGTGFAPFRGGPVNYIRHRGTVQLLKMLEHLQQRYGPRFKADAGWEQLQ